MLNVILPVGISFYTFQSLSYTLDIYRKKLEPTNNLTAFLAYVAFFPQLVAGPIERASNLLPQFLTARKVTQQSMEMGIWLIIWGPRLSAKCPFPCFAESPCVLSRIGGAGCLLAQLDLPRAVGKMPRKPGMRSDYL